MSRGRPHFCSQPEGQTCTCERAFLASGSCIIVAAEPVATGGGPAAAYFATCNSFTTWSTPGSSSAWRAIIDF